MSILNREIVERVDRSLQGTSPDIVGRPTYFGHNFFNVPKAFSVAPRYVEGASLLKRAVEELVISKQKQDSFLWAVAVAQEQKYELEFSALIYFGFVVQFLGEKVLEFERANRDLMVMIETLRINQSLVNPNLKRTLNIDEKLNQLLLELAEKLVEAGITEEQLFELFA
jgi:hypothetical protein